MKAHHEPPAIPAVPVGLAACARMPLPGPASCDGKTYAGVAAKSHCKT
jgi:hypothetical protein